MNTVNKTFGAWYHADDGSNIYSMLFQNHNCKSYVQSFRGIFPLLILYDSISQIHKYIPQLTNKDYYLFYFFFHIRN